MTSGIVSAELAAIFYPVEEPVPDGWKRPLRIKSKARVMIGDEVMMKQQLQLAQKKILAEEKKRKRATKPPCNGQQTKRQSQRRRADDDDFCCICAIDYQDYEENQYLEEVWVACSGSVDDDLCTHWYCPACLRNLRVDKDSFVCSACAARS